MLVIPNDEIVHFVNKHPRCVRKYHYQKPLRHVIVARPEHDRPLELAINNLDHPVHVIAERYQDRWQIELFFKWIKQHFCNNAFLGRNENALYNQIPTAWTTYLLFVLCHKTENFTGRLWTLFSQARATLLQGPAIKTEDDRKPWLKSLPAGEGCLREIIPDSSGLAREYGISIDKGTH